MRLAVCMHRACTSIEKLPDYTGPAEAAQHYDVVLNDWVERHLHGEKGEETPNERHPGGRVVAVDTSNATDDEGVDALIQAALSEISAELELAQQQVFDYRDELRDSAAKCYLAHGAPDFSDGRGCQDYRTTKKAVGRAEQLPPAYRKYLCQWCPYQSTVMVTMRARRGDYKG